MRSWLSAVVSAVVLAGLPLPCGAEEATDLTGEWAVVAVESEGKAREEINFAGMTWTFAENSLVVKPGRTTPAGLAGRPPLNCSVALDDSQTPRHFDWTLGEGERTRLVKGIYEVQDGVLRICFKQGGVERPTSFATQGTQAFRYEFKRVEAKQ